MDLRRIRHFVAVAEEGSFTRAAELLHISQPPLSQSLKALEEEMNVQLLVRDYRGVKLTDAGQVFLRQSRHILRAVRHAVDETVHAAAGKRGTLRVGTITTALFGVLPPILRAWQTAMPEVEVTLFESTSQGQVAALQHDELDLTIMHGPLQTQGLHIEQLCSERMCAVFPRSHPMASNRPISLSAMSDMDFVLFSRQQSPGFFDAIASMCVVAGFSPRIKHVARDSATMVRMVALGMGVALVSESLTNLYPDEVCFRRLDDPKTIIEYWIAWNAQSGSDLTQEAIAIARQAVNGKTGRRVSRSRLGPSN